MFATITCRQIVIMMMEIINYETITRDLNITINQDQNDTSFRTGGSSDFIQHQEYLQLITSLPRGDTHSRYQSDIEFAYDNSYEQFIYTIFILASTLLANSIKLRKQYRYRINEDGNKLNRGMNLMASFNISNLEAPLGPANSNKLGIVSSSSSSAAFLKELLLDTSTIFDADYPSQDGDTVAETLASLTSTTTTTPSSISSPQSSTSQQQPVTSTFQQSMTSNLNGFTKYYDESTTLGNNNYDDDQFITQHSDPDPSEIISLYDQSVARDLATSTATTSLAAYNDNINNNNSLPMRMARRLGLIWDNLMSYLQNRIQEHTATSIASLSVVIIVITIIFCVIINWSREEEKRVKEQYRKLARGSSQSYVAYEPNSSVSQSTTTKTSSNILTSTSKSKTSISKILITKNRLKKGTSSISHHNNRFCSLSANPTPTPISLSNNHINNSSSSHGFLHRNRNNSSYSELSSEPSEISSPSSPTALIPPTSKSTSPLSSPSFHNAAIGLFMNNNHAQIGTTQNIRSTSALSDQYHRIESVTPITLGKTSPSCGSNYLQNLHIVELRRETYFGLVRLTKPGCRTIVLFCDVQSRNKLLMKFCQCIYPYRKIKALQFAFLLIEKNISWYKAILTLALNEKRDLHINPINCIGTVLCLNGFKKHFSVYHASDSKCDPDEPCLLLEESLLDNFPRWLEQLFAGKTNRYYVKYWPEHMR